MMEFEFDKEIDSLLRQTAQGETVLSNENRKSKIENQKSVHLDADEIAAFAENALPEKARSNYIAHLADCDRCRKLLSNLIVLNSDSQSEIVHAEEPQTLISVAPEIPWYRKLLAVPNLVYAMGALVLLFSGIGVYTILQNVGSEQNSMVSQTYEKQPAGKGMSSDGDAAATGESFAGNTATAANLPMQQQNTASTNSATTNSTANISNPAILPTPRLAANANAPLLRDETDQDVKGAPEASASDDSVALSEKKDYPPAAAPPPPPPAKENNYTPDGATKNQPSAPLSSISQQDLNKSASGGATQPAPKAVARADKKRKAESDNEERQKSLDATSVGGKTFKRENNVWYDAAYRGQATTNVSRGTNEYKKLDAGLRGIAENLGGTVVVVWKQKAYRIQ